MKLSEWANIAEIIASIVIVLSLVYVGMEINQNTQALQNESHLDILAMLTEAQMTLVSNDELHRTIMTAENSPADVSAEEWSKFVEFTFPRIGVWEYLFLANQRDILTEGMWVGFQPYFQDLMCTPGYRRWWNENGHKNDPSFIAHVESQVIPHCDK